MRPALLALIMLIFSHFGAAQEPIEEIVAVVGTTPILHSDLILAEAVELLPPDPNEDRQAFRGRLVDARIRLELQFRNLEESGTLYRLSLDHDGALESLVAAAGSEEALGRSLEARGLVWSDVEDLALRVAAVQAYVQERLRPRISVTLEELEAAHRELGAELAAAGEPLPAFGEVREQLHRLVVERKLNWEIERWLAQARERQAVTRFSP